MKKLNTMETFEDGFKIERDGKVIQLTKHEMFEIYWLINAIRGKRVVEDCINSNEFEEEDRKLLDEMMEDDNVCYSINADVMEYLDENFSSVRDDIVDEYLGYMKEGD